MAAQSQEINSWGEKCTSKKQTVVAITCFNRQIVILIEHFNQQHSLLQIQTLIPRHQTRFHSRQWIHRRLQQSLVRIVPWWGKGVGHAENNTHTIYINPDRDSRLRAYAPTRLRYARAFGATSDRDSALRASDSISNSLRSALRENNFLFLWQRCRRLDYSSGFTWTIDQQHLSTL